MSRFPFVTGLDDSIVNAITNTDKTKFSGTKAFAFLQCFMDNNNVPGGIIGNESYTQFNISHNVNNLVKKIPPMLKSIEVKTTGNMGAIKMATATIQFSDMDEVKANRGFMFIGKTQLLVWGWAKNRLGIQTNVESGMNTALKAVNILQHNAYVTGNDFDIFAGILTNFDIKINANLTVDVQVELSSPSDIPAFLALSKNNESVADSSDDKKAKATIMATQAAKIDPDTSDAAIFAALKGYTINTESEILNWSYGNTDSAYMQLGFVIKTVCNKGKDSTMNGGMPIDVQIDDAVACARPMMISCSENVIIPSAQIPKTDDTKTVKLGETTIKTVRLDSANPITFGPFNLAEPFQFPTPTDTTLYSGVTLKGNEHGHIRNLFLSADFLKEAARGMDNNKEFLEKIIAELNVAGAGLWNLGLRDIEGPHGFMQYTIVDYNLSNENNAIPSLNLFSESSTITNIDLNADMPKEVAGQAMLGDEGKASKVQSATHPVGDFLFKTSAPDAVIGALKAPTANYKAHGASTENSGTPAAPVELTFGDKVALKWNAAVDGVKGAVGAVADGASYLAEQAMSALSGMLNAPGELRVKLNSAPYYSGNESSYFVVVKDAGIVKNLYFPESGGKASDVLLPTKLTFTTLGVGGFVIGKSVKINGIPWLTPDKGYWQITDITQKIDETKWEIDVELRFRVKRGGGGE
jgi:hypothetical protein